MCLFFEKKGKSYTCCDWLQFGWSWAVCSSIWAALRGGFCEHSVISWLILAGLKPFLRSACRTSTSVPSTTFSRRARVFLARCAAENSTILCALVAFWVPESCVVSLCASISISALTHVVFSQWSFGPYGQASSRSRPNDGRNESFPCVHVWSGLCIACPYRCWIVLILFWWIGEVRCCTWPKTTLVPDVPFLSVVVRPRGQRCQNKIGFDRLQPEQIKQDEVKSFEFYLIYIYIYLFISCYVYLFLFMCIYFFLCIFISFYFFLFLFIAVYFFLFLFISLFWRKKENMILNVFFLIFGSSKPCCN